jgi:hydrogenase/urease accessory protein HupE
VRGRSLLAVGGAAALLAPAAAHAHLVTTGLGPVYDGVTHFFVSVDDLLPVVALSLLSGANGTAAARRSLFVLPAAWLVSGFAGFQARGASLPAWAVALSLLLLGLLVAANLRLEARGATALAVALGGLHGWLNGAALAADGRPASALAGIAAAIFVVCALVTALVVSLRAPWTRIAVRVAGSWIAAIGLLMAGWALR